MALSPPENRVRKRTFDPNLIKILVREFDTVVNRCLLIEEKFTAHVPRSKHTMACNTYSTVNMFSIYSFFLSILFN